MRERLTLVLALGALTAVLLALAPTALAVKSSVRIEAKSFTALPRTWVDESSAGGTYSDTDGTEYKTTEATAFGATALATARGGVNWDFSVFGLGPFITSFSGQMMDPVTFADWWSFAV